MKQMDNLKGEQKIVLKAAVVDFEMKRLVSLLCVS